jgi:hypothetical protein
MKADRRASASATTEEPSIDVERVPSEDRSRLVTSVVQNLGDDFEESDPTLGESQIDA